MFKSPLDGNRFGKVREEQGARVTVRDGVGHSREGEVRQPMGVIPGEVRGILGFDCFPVCLTRFEMKSALEGDC